MELYIPGTILKWDHRYCPITLTNNKHFSFAILYQLNCKTCFSGYAVQYTAIQKRSLPHSGDSSIRKDNVNIDECTSNIGSVVLHFDRLQTTAAERGSGKERE